MQINNVTEVAENIFRIWLPMPFGLNHIYVYLLRENNHLALVDCGLDRPESQQNLDESLAQLGLAPGQLTDIFVTHGHPDHIGQLDRLRRLAPEARLHIHKQEYTYMAGRAADPPLARLKFKQWFEQNGLNEFSSNDFTETGIETLPDLKDGDRLLQDGEMINFEPSAVPDHPVSHWNVIWTPGHTAGHFVLYNAGRQLMLSGDHLLGSISSNIGKYPGSTDDPLGDFINSLERISQLEISEVFPAHGKTFNNHRERIKELLDHHRQRLAKIYASLEQRPRTAAQVVEVIWGDRAVGIHRYLAMVEALSHLERLRREGYVIAEVHGARILYRVA